MREQIVTVTAPAHMASYLVNNDASGVTVEEILAVEAWLDGLEILDVARDADGDCLDPHFTWSFDLYGGTARGGDVLDYIAREVHRCPDCHSTDWDNECCDQYKVYQGDGTFITIDWNA